MSSLVKLKLSKTPFAIAGKLQAMCAGSKLVLKPSYEYYLSSSLGKSLTAQYKEKMDWLKRYYALANKNSSTKVSSKYLLTGASLVDIEAEVYTGSLDILLQQMSPTQDEYFKNLTESLKALSPDNSHYQPMASVIPAAQSIPVQQNLVRVILKQPANEFDVLAGSHYSYVSEDFKSLDKHLDNLKFKQKEAILKKQLSADVPLQYKITAEILATTYEMAQLVEKYKINVIGFQEWSPYFGYDLETFSTGENSEILQNAFDISYQLFGLLQAEGFHSLAPFALLSGFRQRYLIEISLYSIKQLARSSTDTPLEMKLAEAVELAYPVLWEVRKP